MFILIAVWERYLVVGLLGIGYRLRHRDRETDAMLAPGAEIGPVAARGGFVCIGVTHFVEGVDGLFGYPGPLVF